MPTISLSDISSDIVRNNIAASIALQEAALAHILNAEGEKLQAVIAIEDVTIEQLTQVNTSVVDLMEHAASFELALQEKLQHVFPSARPVEPIMVMAVGTKSLFGGSPAGGVVAFRESLYAYGSAVSHAADTVDFIINEDGNYRINYQSVISNEALSPGQPINEDLSLTSGRYGILATNTITINTTFVQNSTIASLPAGDVLRLSLVDNSGSLEISAIASAISIEKVNLVL
jgi:hypothetical protein